MGYKLIKVSPNRMKPQYDVYWFEDTPQFREDIPIAVEESREK